ncbi:hypothetical protein ABEF95_000001, partial [Exophiala dermatitidis]
MQPILLKMPARHDGPFSWLFSN